MSDYLLAAVILIVGFTPLTLLIAKTVRQRRSVARRSAEAPVSEETVPVASRKAMPSVDDLVARSREDARRIEVRLAGEEDDDDVGIW